jgi:autotransporter-associated beta strand protein
VAIDVASGQQTQTAAGYSNLSFTTASSVTKTGGGTLVLDQANTLTGTVTIQGGVVQLSGTTNAALSATFRPEAGGKLTVAPALQTTIDGLKVAAGGLTDVGTGKVTVAAGGLSASEMVLALVAGRNGGTWDGSVGILSSAAAASGGTRTVGWLEDVVLDGSFNPVPNLGSVTFAFAAPGDTNLDWFVDILDAANFLSGGKFDSGTPASWNQGDFTYDGVVDILDAADFMSTGLFDAGPYGPQAAAGGVVAVPEPALGLAGLMAAGLAVGCRRRARPARRPPHSASAR